MIKMKKLIKLSALALVLIMMVAAFASCAAPAKDPKDAAAALKDAGYVVFTFDGDTLAYMYDFKGLETVVTGVDKENEDNGIVIFYFEDADAADEAWEDIEKEATEEEIEDVVVKKSGAMIWYGTKEAVKAAK